VKSDKDTDLENITNMTSVECAPAEALPKLLSCLISFNALDMTGYQAGFMM
jgi:hypothetical protein